MCSQGIASSVEGWANGMICGKVAEDLCDLLEMGSERKGKQRQFSARAWDEARALIWSTRRRGVDLPSLYGLSVSQN